MSNAPQKSLIVVAALSACTTLLACEKKEDPKPTAPAASSLAPSVAAPTSMVVKLKIDPKSSTKIDMPAPQEQIKAQTSAADGHLDVDLMDVTQTRGEIKVDLTSLKTSTFNDASKDGTQTAHALTWLEVADAAKEKLAEDVKAQNKFATFAIRSIDGVAQKDLSKVTPKAEEGSDVRAVDLVAHGELLVHGHKVNKDVPLTVKFIHPTGALASTKPKSVKIVSKEPFKVTLAEHEVRPRDDVGKIAKAAFSILGTKVADTASITVDFSAIPAE